MDEKNQSVPDDRKWSNDAGLVNFNFLTKPKLIDRETGGGRTNLSPGRPACSHDAWCLFRPPTGDGMLAMGTMKGRVRLSNPSTGTTRWEVQSTKRTQNDARCRVAMAPDGRFMASVVRSEDYWTLFDAASGVVCMTAARRRDRSVQLLAGQIQNKLSRNARGGRYWVPSISAYCGIASGGVLTVRAKACNRRF